MDVALVHDYLTQRGGAERVVLAMLKAFPGAPLHTSLYDADMTFPDFREAHVRTFVLNRVGPFRRNHRLALPLLAPAFSVRLVNADVVVCSSSGWAHGVRTRGRKIVYCYSPARWLYQADRYLGRDNGNRLPRAALKLLASPLQRWDRRAARRADRYLTSSGEMQRQIRAVYGIDAEVLPPPLAVASNGSQRRPDSLEPGYFLCVSRLLPYKNVAAVVDAFARLPRDQLVIVGTGPEEHRLRRHATRNVRFLGVVSDEELRWLYRNTAGVVSASFEDYGLTPLEGASLGRPAAVLRWGGFLDTVVEGVTGVFFDRPEPTEIRTAVERLRREDWSEGTLQQHAATFSEQAFVSRLREIVAEEAASASNREPSVVA
jgi:glycosyltransferase involved in cell wall biosynthesis